MISLFIWLTYRVSVYNLILSYSWLFTEWLSIITGLLPSFVIFIFLIFRNSYTRHVHGLTDLFIQPVIMKRVNFAKYLEKLWLSFIVSKSYIMCVFDRRKAYSSPHHSTIFKHKYFRCYYLNIIWYIHEN